MADRDQHRSRTGDAADNAASPRAFTLLEVVVVITVLSIFAALAIPRVAGVSDRARLTAAERQIRATITEAERTAFRRGQIVRVTVVPALHEIRVQTGGQTQTLRLSDRPYEVEFETVSFGTAMTFDIDPASGQRPSGTMTLRRGSNKRTVNLTPTAALVSGELVDTDLLPALVPSGIGAGKGGLGGTSPGGFATAPGGLD